MKIPKIIHYCWFGNKELNERAKKCIRSWEKYCPDYQFICWNETNSSIKDNLYVKEAFEAEKWAFVSDYIRLKALCTYGGIYLDTDVELLKSLDDLLDCEAFVGFETNEKISTALLATTPGHSIFKEMLETYSERRFLLPNGSYDQTTNVEIFTEILEKHGLEKNGKSQNINSISVYPADFFSPKNLETGKIKITSNTYAIHFFNASWMSFKQRINTRIAQILGPKATKKIKNMLRGKCK